jgi:outer membrane protein TolC
MLLWGVVRVSAEEVAGEQAPAQAAVSAAAPVPAQAAASTEAPAEAQAAAQAAVSAAVPAPAGPSAPQPIRLELTLREALLTALEHNLDISVQRFTPLIRQAEVLQALGTFDTTAFLDTALERDKTPPSVILPPVPAIRTDTLGLDFGLRRRFSTGATAELSYADVYTADFVNPSIQGSILAVTQPLLLGAGPAVNLSDVRIARNTRRASVYDFQQGVIDVISQVEQAYWNLVFAGGNLEVARRALQLAEQLLESNRQRVQVGVLAPAEIVRAQSSVAAQQAAILDAETAVRDAQDALRRLINPPSVDLADDADVLPTDKPRTDYEPLDLKRVIYQALIHRPDLISRKTTLQNLGINVVVAQNQLLPTLDLTVFYRTKGAGRSLASTTDSLSSFLFDDYGTTVAFSLPLEQRTAKGSVAKARLQVQQALLELKNTEEGVVLQVRQQLRRVQTKYEQIGRFRRARELAGERLQAENEKLIHGTATTLDVLQGQGELASAERDELRSAVDFNIALVELRRAMGTLLEDYQLQVVEP